MKGLILKDFLNLKKACTPLLFFIAMYFIFTLVSGDGSFFSGVIFIFCAMLPVSTMSYDERSGFNKFALAMPVSRSAIVFSKYAVALILIAVAAIASTAVNMIVGTESIWDTILASLMVCFIAILMISLSLPAVFKFGTEKGRFVMIGSVMLIGLIIAASTFAYTKSETTSITSIPAAEATVMPIQTPSLFESPMLFGLLLIGGAILCLSLSVALSIRIYQKKDF